MSTKDPVPCLYCGREDVPKTKEHVLQRTFKANLTLVDEVCGDCNSAFSKLDGALKNLLDALGVGRSATLLQQSLAVEGSGLIVRIANDGRPRTPPQIRVPDGSRSFQMSCDNQDMEPRALQEVMLEELRKPADLNLRTAVDDRVSEPTIVRSGSRKYKLVGPSIEGLQRVEERILGGLFKSAAPSKAPQEHGTIEQPRVTMSLRVDMGAILRAIAKIGVNALAYARPELARAPELAPVRDYVLKGGSDNFAQLLDRTKSTPMGLSVPAGQHAIMLSSTTAGLVALVWVHGRPLGSVRLSEGHEGSSMGPWVAFFDPTERTSRIGDHERDPLWFVKLVGHRSASTSP